MTGCLVTEPITFEEEKNFPPTLLDEPGTETPIGEVIGFNLSDPNLNEIVFQLQIRDENTLQTLQTRHQLVSLQTTLDITELEVGISGDPIRPFEFSIPRGQLEEDACYRVKLAVTSQFKGDPNNWDLPAEEGDVAIARWWIYEEGAVLLSSCPFRHQFNE
jgi:hypothetical protein